MNSLDTLKARLSKTTGRTAPEAVYSIKPDVSLAAQYQRTIDERNFYANQERMERRAELQHYEFKTAVARANEVADDVDEFFKTREQPEGTSLRGGSLIAHVTDTHFGARIEGMEARDKPNVFDFSVAAHRLAVFAEQIKFYGTAHGAKELCLVFTGDLFNSRVGKESLDKILTSECTGAEAFLRGRDLIYQLVLNLMESGLFAKVRLCGVAGNEARLTREKGHSVDMAADNWDSLLYGELASKWENCLDVNFGVNRVRFEVQGWQVLLMHGDTGVDKHCSDGTTKKLLSEHSCTMAFSGHIHDSLVRGNWIRSASLMGTDFYAGDGLTLNGPAAQTIVWCAPGQRNVIVVDLQNPDPNVKPFMDTSTISGYGKAFGPQTR